MEDCVIIGTGGHAKVVIDILQEVGAYGITGCVGPDGPVEVLGVPRLGGDDVLSNLYSSGLRFVFVALGNNELRRTKTAMATELGFRLLNVISPRAVISRRAELGRGVAIMAGTVINVMSRVDDGAIINTGATVDHDCLINRFAHIGPGTHLAGSVSVGEGAFLGTGVRAIPGVSIGRWATVGAGAVVIRDVPAGVTAVGIPSTVIKRCY
jgi:UDP-perosamine 4-acetyltransferase